MPLFVNPDDLGEPVGLYSHLAIDERTGLAFVAGQLAVKGGLDEAPPTDFGEQLQMVLENLRAATAPVGGLSSICQMTTYLVSPDDITEFYENRARLFPDFFGPAPYPPNTLLVVSRLVGPLHRVEIQAIASPK